MLALLSLIDDALTYVNPNPTNTNPNPATAAAPSIKLIMTDNNDMNFSQFYFRVFKYLIRLSPSSSLVSPSSSSSSSSLIRVTIETEQQKYVKFVQNIKRD